MAVILHHLLTYSQYDLGNKHCSQLVWNLKLLPSEGAHYNAPTYPRLSEEDLQLPATTPSVTSLHIICGLFPYEWPIIAYNIAGVTIQDVLTAIYECLHRQVSMREWSGICPKQRERIRLIFDARWRLSSDPAAAHSVGLLRLDSLLKHTMFGGLTAIPADEPTCVLTLRIPR
ncbi:hypothetical protein AMATHDRAFT_147427 [Amanita thiersii Skay4041]|uniref:DUF6699 domain-containing protein n=1 Tax=Amanita thiersii Skay4041 TaxID=703135 RepID=A0A2A9NF03_9AGAR|nr:hypothetical protein AMATHDRAFT_147427 [Amanita thiersii Skay4041]